MQRFISENKGFTLVEVILSIALLSLASVVVLRLFITSVDMNTQSRHSDIAGVLAANTLEILKVNDSEEEILRSFEDMTATDKGYVMTKKLDTAFTTIKEAESTGTAYILELVLTATDRPGLYEVQVTVTDIQDDSSLASYRTKHYLSQEVSVHE